MKIFIVLYESPLKILKIAIYRFLISFLVPELLTLRAPRVLVPTPSTKGGVEKDPPQYLKNEKCYKPETFGGVRSIL